MNIGSTLRDAREHRGLSIDEVSRTTKISGVVLRAIELNAFERLPAEVFTRGFLRAYAQEVGVDPRPIVEHYSAELDAEPGRSDPIETPSAAPSSGAEPTGGPAGPTGFATRHWRTPTVLVLAGAGTYLFFMAMPRSQPLAPVPPPSPRVETAAPPVPAPEADSIPRATPVGTSGQGLQVELVARGPCWVAATADGTRVAYKTFEAGERQTIAIRDALDLRVGDAGAISFSIDGVPGRSLGAAGQPLTVRIALDNYRDLLEPALQR